MNALDFMLKMDARYANIKSPKCTNGDNPRMLTY